jgi:hypothetical protein
LLPDGKVLVSGGATGLGPLASAELYDVGLNFTNSWQPQITSVNSPLADGGNLTLTGSKFRGIAGASSGHGQDSATDYPLVQLRSLENEQTAFLLPASWSTNSFTSVPVTNFPPSHVMVTVFVNGVPSASSIVRIEATPSATAPQATTLAATSIGVSNATLNATVNPGGAVTTAYFQYGLTTNYGSVTTTSNLVAGQTNVNVSIAVSGLTPGTPHHFRVVATNSAGTNAGVNLTFATAFPTATPPKLMNLALVGDTFQFSFTNTPAAPFSVLSTTNVALPLTNWTLRGSVMEISPGQFQFTDSQATGTAQRFYLVRSP